MGEGGREREPSEASSGLARPSEGHCIRWRAGEEGEGEEKKGKERGGKERGHGEKHPEARRGCWRADASDRNTDGCPCFAFVFFFYMILGEVGSLGLPVASAGLQRLSLFPLSFPSSIHLFLPLFLLSRLIGPLASTATLWWPRRATVGLQRPLDVLSPSPSLAHTFSLFLSFLLPSLLSMLVSI